MKIDIDIIAVLLSLTLILSVLKILNIINLSWIIVFIPLFVPLLLLIILFITLIIGCVLILLPLIFDKKSVKWLKNYTKELKNVLDKENLNK